VAYGSRFLARNGSAQASAADRKYREFNTAERR